MRHRHLGREEADQRSSGQCRDNGMEHEYFDVIMKQSGVKLAEAKTMQSESQLKVTLGD